MPVFKIVCPGRQPFAAIVENQSLLELEREGE
jgi:hypothetical protein